MEDREEVLITTELRGKFVFAKAPKGQSPYYHDWLLLINKACPDIKTNPMIYTHLSYDTVSHAIYLDDCPKWGRPFHMGYKFYTMKDDEKEILKKILKERNLRFIKAINKIIKR